MPLYYIRCGPERRFCTNRRVQLDIVDSSVNQDSAAPTRVPEAGTPTKKKSGRLCRPPRYQMPTQLNYALTLRRVIQAAAKSAVPRSIRLVGSGGGTTFRSDERIGPVQLLLPDMKLRLKYISEICPSPMVP